MYCTTQQTQEMLPTAGSKPAVAAIRRLETHILGHVATRMGTKYCEGDKIDGDKMGRTLAYMVKVGNTHNILHN
jgi:hypothetical protein